MNSNPAENLVGTVICDRWKVVSRLNANSNDTTGGFFSIPYRVEDVESGEPAFMKVLNLQKAMSIYQDRLNPTEALNRATEGHLFECDLADACANRKMSRIVRAVDHGHTPINIPGFGPVGHGFIVFELGIGDTHHLLKFSESLDLSWKMRILHQAAVAVQQLHSADIAHQDLKRSNVIFFGESESKLADLGRAVKRDRHSNNDQRVIPCQIANSPPELIYGFTPADWDQRHFATDLYMLGNLAFCMFFDLTLTACLIRELPKELRPKSIPGGEYQGGYANVVPFLRNALNRVLTTQFSHVDSVIREKWTTTLAMLCEPDPAKRGHPKDHSSKHISGYSAERFISAFRDMELRALLRVRE